MPRPYVQNLPIFHFSRQTLLVKHQKNSTQTRELSSGFTSKKLSSAAEFLTNEIVGWKAFLFILVLRKLLIGGA